MYVGWVPFDRPPTRLAYGVVIGLPTGTPVMLVFMLTFGVPPYYFLARNPFQTPVILRNYEWGTRPDSPESTDGTSAQDPKEGRSSPTMST